jgi:hypothetical protein
MKETFERRLQWANVEIRGRESQHKKIDEVYRSYRFPSPPMEISKVL